MVNVKLKVSFGILCRGYDFTEASRLLKKWQDMQLN